MRKFNYFLRVGLLKLCYLHKMLIFRALWGKYLCFYAFLLCQWYPITEDRDKPNT